MLLMVGKSLSMRWGVPRNLEEAIYTELKMKKGITRGKLQNMVHHVEAATLLLNVLIGMLFTSPWAGIKATMSTPTFGPNKVVELATLLSDNGASALIISIFVLVLSIILHVKATEPWSLWNKFHSVQHYRDLCMHFLVEQGQKVQSFVENYGASWTNGPPQRSEEIDHLKAQMLSSLKASLENAD
jgi:hypothetical protein